MKNRTWAMVFVSAIAALLLVWKLLPAGSGQTAGVYQDEADPDDLFAACGADRDL